MSDLTREEMRAACEAVGWRWEHHAVGPRAVEIDLRDRPAVRTVHRFSPASGRERWQADALALLEATGKDYTVWRRKLIYERTDQGADFVVTISWGDGDTCWIDPDLPTVAVRAVNAWAEREESA